MILPNTFLFLHQHGAQPATCFSTSDHDGPRDFQQLLADSRMDCLSDNLASFRNHLDLY